MTVRALVTRISEWWTPTEAADALELRQALAWLNFVTWRDFEVINRTARETPDWNTANARVALAEAKLTPWQRYRVRATTY